MPKLDLGCGQAKAPGHIGMDIFPGNEVDVVHDFNVVPYPFADNEFDEVVARSVLEHVDDLIATVTEIHRILRPGGLLKVYCPHFSGPDAYRDPTHKTFFAYTTFDRFTQGGSYLTVHSGMFTLVQRSFGLPERTGGLKGVVKRLANAYPDLYEHNLCWLLPTKTIYYELSANKAVPS